MINVVLMKTLVLRSTWHEIVHIVYAYLIGFSNTAVGNSYWQAPELVNTDDDDSEDEDGEERREEDGDNDENDQEKHRPDYKVDIWSLGILGEIFFLRVFF